METINRLELVDTNEWKIPKNPECMCASTHGRTVKLLKRVYNTINAVRRVSYRDDSQGREKCMEAWDELMNLEYDIQAHLVGLRQMTWSARK